MKSPDYYQTRIPPDDRPDGRIASPAILQLRRATRALRLHLAQLPIEYSQLASGDEFLSGLSFMFARHRYECAESLIGSGMGGTVLGAIARSLLIDGLRWRWVAADPNDRRACLLGDLLEERNNVCGAARANNVPVPNLSRWLMPIPPVSDLTGESLEWLSTPPLPGDEALLSDLLNAASSESDAGLNSDPMHLLDAAGMRGAVLVLAFAGHGNYLGLQSCLSEDGQPGMDLRDVFEALFMHVAAVGTVTVLHGSVAAVPELWPVDVPKEPFLQEALRLAGQVAEDARQIHGLFAATPRKFRGSSASVHRPDRLLDPRAVLTAHDVRPFGGDLSATIDAAERFWAASRLTPVRSGNFKNAMLHEVLNFGGAYANLEAALATYDKEGSGPISVFAARMLLEEAARLHWRFSVADEKQFAQRATQYFDEFRARKRSTVNLLRGNGVPRLAAERLFELPSYVVAPPLGIAKDRKKIPSVTSLLRAFGHGTQPRDPGWLVVAYSLLSQLTHATPLGSLHTVRFGEDEVWYGNELSPELLALSLDITCIASAYLIGHSSLILTELSAESILFRDALRREASKVHDAARAVHGLG